MMPFPWPGRRRCRRTRSIRINPAKSGHDLFPPLRERVRVGLLLKRRDPSDFLANSEQVDLVRAFVGKDRLEIGHMPHYWIFEADAVGAEDATRLTGDLQRLAHIVHLRHRDLGRSRLALIFEPTKL